MIETYASKFLLYFNKYADSYGHNWYLPLIWIIYLCGFAGFLPLITIYFQQQEYYNYPVIINIINIAFVILAILCGVTIKWIFNTLPLFLKKLYKWYSFLINAFYIIKILQFLKIISIIQFILSLQIAALINYIFSLFLIISPFTIFLFSLYQKLYQKFSLDYFYYTLDPFKIIHLSIETHILYGLLLIKFLSYILYYRFITVIIFKFTNKKKNIKPL